MPLPQRIAATPGFIPRDLREAAPGHRFQLYLENWQAPVGNEYAPYKKAKPFGKDERATYDRECAAVLKDLCPLPVTSQKVLAALRARQQALHAHHGPHGLRISASSTAPFATGLGNEHPIENGFAFLTPYGLPYLAGSGVKGVLRRAMQELRDDGEEGFTEAAIDALFGPEKIDKPEDARRGALDFWDVFPSPTGGKLVVEIMTPHYGEYYRGKQSPHDSGAPVPVSFLAVPAGSAFDFHVVCHATRLPAGLRDTWKNLIQQAFTHAFEWVGFGAKTSVGYGVMAAKGGSLPSSNASGIGVAATNQVTGSAEAETLLWSTATLRYDKSKREVTASFEGKSTASLKGAEAEKLLTALGEERANKLKSKAELKNIAVNVKVQGNSLILDGVVAP